MVTKHQLICVLTTLQQYTSFKSKADGLEKIRDFCSHELDRIREDKIRKLATEAIDTKNKFLVLCAEAMLHDNLEQQPTTERLGYELADIKESSSKLTKEQKSIYNKINQVFDVYNYIFSHTHYDECSGDYFFRRS
jgi:hypothetical protein